MAAAIHLPTSPPSSSSTSTSRSLLLSLFPKTLPFLSLPKPNSRRRLAVCSVSAAQLVQSSPPSLAGDQSPKPLSPPNRRCSRNRTHYVKLLRLSAQYGDVELARAVHAFFAKVEEDPSLSTALVAAYLKLGLLRDAYTVFSSLSTRNLSSYSMLISGFSKNGEELRAVELFFEMRESGIEPNGYSFVAILTACNRIQLLHLGSQIHALVVKMGLLGSVFVSNALMGLYSNCGCFDCVHQVFDEMPERDIVSWNTVLSSLVKELKYVRAFELFCHMQGLDGFSGVDHMTLSTLLTACKGCAAVEKGRELHAYAIKHGLGGNLSVSNALLGFYTKCGSLDDVVGLIERMPYRDVISMTGMICGYMEFGLVDLAVKVFYSMPDRNVTTYSALLAGYCHNGKAWRALTLFVSMVVDGVELSESILTSILGACGLLVDGAIGKQIHAFVLKFGFGSNLRIESALLDMCTRCGNMADAEKMFGQRPFDQDRYVEWTSMICGYARNGQLEEAIHLFHRYHSEGTAALDDVATTSVLAVCGSLGFHELGKQIHSHALKSQFVTDLRVGNSLISMYSKCWDMDDAIKVFNAMSVHDIVSWNGLMAGYVFHGKGDKALALWSKIEKARVEPDMITFYFVISSYRHTRSNLVEDCLRFFHSMETLYGIEPTSHHYASLIGVLGFWGHFVEAKKIISNMPFEPTSSVWRGLLNTSRIHQNITLENRAARRILAMEPQDPSTYILTANLHSASGRWFSSEMVREEMREKGMRKLPARSWIVLGNTVQPFYSRDRSHSQTEQIYNELETLIPRCIDAGYVPDKRFALHGAEEHHKENILFHHSAKLAVSYGLLVTKPGKPIRVVKSVQLCGDCHSFLKFVSVVTKREIVFRDSSGFHFFSNGKCSCREFR